jgi:hypothetical protein
MFENLFGDFGLLHELGFGLRNEECCLDIGLLEILSPECWKSRLSFILVSVEEDLV